MLLPSILNQRDPKQESCLIGELLETNRDSEKHGLALTPEDAEEVIVSRDASLQNHGRIEIGLDTAKKLIQRLSDSPFICQEEYTAAIINIQELFYYIKNETEDKIGDDELIEVIFNFYDTVCEGSALMLREMLERYAENLRCENQKKDYLSIGVEKQWR